MTIKEFNTIRSAAYAAANEIPEIKHALDVAGVAYVFDIQEGNHRELLVLTARTQLNDNTLAAHGFTADAAVHTLLKAQRQTKSIKFRGEA
jgi:hypothetical protein